MDHKKQAMADLQEAMHGSGHDYDVGSPHLRHRTLHSQIAQRIRGLVADQFTRTGGCRVLEIGAGHGTFTELLAASGAEVTVTEMSRPSLDVLQRRFANNAKVRLVYDADGESAVSGEGRYDLVLCVSVLHHVPDYVTFVQRLAGVIDEGGAFASFQEPLWYPRRSRLNLAADRAAYFAWRVGQGDLRRGVMTRVRRVRGIFDEGNPADMVECHVVRQGVDEERLIRSLSTAFAQVEGWTYWSTQSPVLQAAGERTKARTTFALVARGRLATASVQGVGSDEHSSLTRSLAG